MRRFHSAKEALTQVFGYADFRPHQEEIIEAVIEGRDALVLMPTGGGKSLCYQIPALVREGTAVIVSPLIALMQDQITVIQNRGLEAACLSSANSLEENREIESQFLSGTLDFLYVTPERLVNEWTISMLQRARVSLFAVDEAHCVVTWGARFPSGIRRARSSERAFPVRSPDRAHRYGRCLGAAGNRGTASD